MSAASKAKFPNPRGTDLGDVARALEQAQSLKASGQLFDALKWLRHAANVAAEAGDDERAMQLFKAAADVQTELDAGVDRSGPIRALSPRQPTTRFGVLAKPATTPMPGAAPATVADPRAQAAPAPDPETMETRAPGVVADAVKRRRTEIETRMEEDGAPRGGATQAGATEGWDSMHDKQTMPIDVASLRGELHARGINSPATAASADPHVMERAVAAADITAAAPHPFAEPAEPSSAPPGSDASGARLRPVDSSSQPGIGPAADGITSADTQDDEGTLTTESPHRGLLSNATISTVHAAGAATTDRSAAPRSESLDRENTMRSAGALSSFHVWVFAGDDGSLRLARVSQGAVAPENGVPATLLPTSPESTRDLKKLFGDDD